CDLLVPAPPRSRSGVGAAPGLAAVGSDLGRRQSRTGNELDERREHLRIAGDDALPEEIVGVAAKIPHEAAGLGHQQAAGRDVPGAQAQLEEAVVAGAGGIREGERGRARSTHARGTLDQQAKQRHELVEIVEPALREAGADERLVEAGAVRYPDPPIVEEGAPAAGGGEELDRKSTRLNSSHVKIS